MTSGLAAMLAVMALACGTTQVDKELSVEQYMDAVCRSELSALQQNRPHSTWGQFRDDTQNAIDIIEELKPPAVLEEYHSTVLAGWRTLVAMIEEHDQDALTNDRDLLEMMPVILATSDATDRAIANLPDDVFMQVTQTKC